MRLLCTTLFLLPVLLFGQSSLRGTVRDASNGEPMIGINVVIQGTSRGAATDIKGQFRIVGIPERAFTIKVSCVGYESQTADVDFAKSKDVQMNFKLQPTVIQGKEFVVTAQMRGQDAAINQQLTSKTITNVVSKDKIQELPDQNAAESIGRLSGISVQRNAGEGTKVSVRGLDPKFSSVTVNGIKIPATDASDRSSDLSMVSSDMLAGISVTKALTPDKDGDVVGGSVDFEMKKAHQGLSTNMSLQGTYNSVSRDYGNYRGSLSASDRLFDDKLGVLATASVQKAYRGSHVLDASYTFDREALPGESYARMLVDNLNIAHRDETRKRYGASIVLDYDLGHGDDIVLSSLYGRTERFEVRNRKRYRVANSYVEYWLRTTETNTDLFTNSLKGKNDFGFMKLEWLTSYSDTRNSTPFLHDSEFRELSPFFNTLVKDKGPELIPLGAKNNLDATRFYQDYFDKKKTSERDFTGQLDFTIPYSFTDDVSGYFKLGGKYRDKKRDVDYEEYFTKPFVIDRIGQAYPTRFNRTAEGFIKINNFYEDRYIGELANGYIYGPANALSRGTIDDFMNTYWKSDYTRNFVKDVEDYTAGEAIVAGYGMAELNIGPLLMILPGFRVERTTTNYKSPFGQAKVDDEGNIDDSSIIDSVGTVSYSEFLPMLHVRYKLTDWFDIRIAVTKSLSRPDYSRLVPWESINYTSGTIQRGNPNLKNTSVWNYDIFFSLYNNYGLVTLGGYYKTLTNIDYVRESRVVKAGDPTNGFKLTQPENSTNESKVYGVELDIQTSLQFLPSPLDGIVLTANYSYIHSKSYMPYLQAGPRNPRPPFNFTFIDTVRESRMPGQAEHLANVSLGYEKGNFSGRVSLIYQGNFIREVGRRAEEDKYDADFVRWDLAMRYKLMPKFSLTFNMNNITNLPESSFQGIESFSTNKEHFGWTADLGIRIDL